MLSQPLVSCLMVTRDRTQLAQRALACFAAQTWERKELVIIDDGEIDYADVLAPLGDALRIRYLRIRNDGGLRLGGLRNLALEEARGEYCIQWDDDEWYHPLRIELQMQALQQQGLDAVVPHWTLMHLDTPEFVDHPYRSCLIYGTPGTILHRRTEVRYPNKARGEDTVFRSRLDRRARVGSMQEPHSHLFIRCFHGQNTWDIDHFRKRLHRTWRDRLSYWRAKYVERDLFTHPAFQLLTAERQAFTDFLSMSRDLHVIAS